METLPMLKRDLCVIEDDADALGRMVKWVSAFQCGLRSVMLRSDGICYTSSRPR